MRATLIAAAFAAGAVAVPYQKRDMVTDTDMNVVYVTDVVTVTDGGAAPTTTAAATTAAQQHYGHGGNGGWHWGWGSSQKTTEQPASTSTYVAPSPSTTEAATSEAPAPSSTAWTSTSAQAPSSAAGAAGSYQSIALAHHNVHRQNHSAPNLEWAAELENSAMLVAQSCVYAHDTSKGQTGYGQNIAAGVEKNNISAVITDLFYNGEEPWYTGLYNQAQPSMTNFEHWGHFSQIVWKATTHVGCYTQDCSSQGLANVAGDVSPYFTVCNYRSPGNYANEYKNVGTPLGHPTVQWNYGM